MYSYEMFHTFGTFLADTTDHHQTRFDNWFGIFEPLAPEGRSKTRNASIINFRCRRQRNPHSGQYPPENRNRLTLRGYRSSLRLTLKEPFYAQKRRVLQLYTIYKKDARGKRKNLRFFLGRGCLKSRLLFRQPLNDGIHALSCSTSPAKCVSLRPASKAEANSEFLCVRTVLAP